MASYRILCFGIWVRMRILASTRVQNFQRTYMVTGGSFGTKTPIHMMYQNMVNGEYGQASAFATVIFILLFGATYLNMRKQKESLED